MMNRLLSTLLAVSCLVFLQAQEGDLQIQDTITTTAQVTLSLNGERITLTVPVTITVDTLAQLENATLKTSATHKVGGFSWQITQIESAGNEFSQDYASVRASSESNHVVLIGLEITNLTRSSLDPNYSSIAEFAGVDEVGNLYKVKEVFCGEIDPNETASCLLGLDVPKNITLVGVEIKAIDSGRIAYKP